MRTTRFIIGLSVAAALLASGCGTTEKAGGGQAAVGGGDPITVVDSRGKTVKLDSPAKRVAATEWNGVEYLVSLGVMPAAVSTISTSIAPERTRVSQISSACSPVSGWEISRFSRSTPSLRA